MADDTRLFYDLTAERTAKEWYENDLLMPTIKDFLSLLPNDSRVLDLGCGPGHESKRLASLGAQVIGIDYSDKCIALARELCPECEFAVMDFRELDDRFGRFDGIFASGSLIHLKPEELPAVLVRSAGLLNAGGYFLMIVQDGEGLNERWSTLEVDGTPLRRPLYCYTKEHLVKAAKESGLEFARPIYLDQSLSEHNWRGYVFGMGRG